MLLCIACWLAQCRCRSSKAITSAGIVLSPCAAAFKELHVGNKDEWIDSELLCCCLSLVLKHLCMCASACIWKDGCETSRV